MQNAYDYQNNISIIKTPNGDFVITMNKEILTAMTNMIYDASQYAEEQGMNGTAADTLKLWNALKDKTSQKN